MIRGLVNALVASMIFFPVRDYAARPADLALPYEEAWMLTEDNVRIHGWFFSSQAGDAAEKEAIVFFHGNATNISGLLTYAKEWVSRNVSVLLLDYRGYAESEGSIRSGRDIFRDAEASVHWLETNKGFLREQIILYGQSIGSAPAVELAANGACRALVLEAPFTSIIELGKIHYALVPEFLLKDFPYGNLEKIRRVQCPVFIIHGEGDEVCPFWMGEKLFEAANQPKELFAVSGANHNNLSLVAYPDFFEKPFQFIRKEGKN
jgi:uncharacterized protein